LQNFFGQQNVYLASTEAGTGASTGWQQMGTWTVANQPVLTVTSSHSDPFFVGQANAAYTLTVTNAGGQPTSGTVTLTDTLPSSLTLSSMSSAGWNCSGATCTYSSSVAAGASFPPVLVAVVPTAVGSGTNQVSVSGGGSATANATDATNIIAASQNCLTITVMPRIAALYGATASPASQCYNNVTNVSVAYNVGGFSFTGFSGGLTGVTNPQTVTVNGQVNITANFLMSFTLSPANQNANLPLPANSSPVSATYMFSAGNPS
jgi:uncharacterized repeat protein (TIGR01451 family)